MTEKVIQSPIVSNNEFRIDRSEIAMGIAVVGILMVMIIPLPTLLLDLLLSCSFTISL